MHGFDLRHAYLVIPADDNLGSQFAQILDQVVGERIVVVQNEDHRLSRLSQNPEWPGTTGKEFVSQLIFPPLGLIHFPLNTHGWAPWAAFCRHFAAIAGGVTPIFRRQLG